MGKNILNRILGNTKHTIAKLTTPIIENQKPFLFIHVFQLYFIKKKGN